MEKWDRKTLRGYAVNSDCTLVTQDKRIRDWLLEVPYEIRDGAVLDFLQALSSNFAKRKIHPPHSFTMRFKSRKQKATECINVLRKAYKAAGVFYPTFMSKIPARSTEMLPSSLDYDSKLIKTGTNQYYLCLPRAICNSSQTKRPGCQIPNKIAFIDPGVRTFGTVYAPLEEKAYKWGDGDLGRIQRLCEHASVLQSKMDQKSCRNRHRKRLAFRRIHEKMKNLIRDFHHHFAKWLCENYQVVVLPHFESQGMSRRSTRKIGKKSVRAMLTWSHYSFRQRLLAKAALYKKCHVYLTTEEYTTKTCTCCGWLNTKIGGSKVFNCDQCCLRMDRDVSGAKGIALLTLSKCASLLRT